MILQGRLLVDPYQIPAPGWIRLGERRIAEIGAGDPPETPAAGDEDSLISPGFFDAHIHLPQIDSMGCDGMGLLQWLGEIIFPAETRWQDQETARAQTRDAYRRMVRAGTLGYAGYLTSHVQGITAVEEAANHLPLRAIVGQVLMDRNAPGTLLEQPPAALQRAPRRRLSLSVNPRFAVSCSDELLASAAARLSGDTFVQTHLAESRRECELVAELFPDDPHYAAVYDRHHLLTDRTLLAHCVHLSDDEWALIAGRGCVVVHCPTANTFLSSGLFDLDSARAHGVRLAIGSDVAAGSELDMPRIGRAMIEVAKMRAMSLEPAAYVPTPQEVWKLITRGNADALGFSGAGRLEVGADADLLLLKPRFEIDKHLISRLIYTWRDDYITHCVLDGQLIDRRQL